MNPLGDLERAAAKGVKLSFLRERGERADSSCGEVLARACAIAAALREAGASVGDPVGVASGEPASFLVSFLAVHALGGVPVPLVPPFSAAGAAGWRVRTAQVLTTARCRFLLADTTAAAVAAPFVGAGLDAVLDPATPREAVAWQAPDRPPGSPALYQFTSGSTGQPKGVVVTWANLDANLDAIVGPHGLDVRADDRAVSWLPLHHDMGLIGMALAGLRAAIPLQFISPLVFLKRPGLWLEALSRESGTISFAPCFGYALAARRVRDAQLEGLDLRAWRVAGCGAEPVRAQVLDTFATRFARCGFRPTAFLPSYGLAESTLAVTFGGRGRPPRVDRVDRGALADGRAVPAPDGLQVVSCGTPPPMHEVRVEGPDGGPLPERVVGEVTIRGPSVSPGYLDAPPRPPDAWFRTGDLGYLAGGELHLCGRKKDLVILAGRNLHPADIEWAAERAPGVRPGGAAAFSTDDEEGERLVVVVELEPGFDPDASAGLIRGAIQAEVGVPPHDLLVFRRRVIPRTSSGKPRRTDLRAAWLAGVLAERVPVEPVPTPEGAS